MRQRRVWQYREGVFQEGRARARRDTPFCARALRAAFAPSRSANRSVLAATATPRSSLEARIQRLSLRDLRAQAVEVRDVGSRKVWLDFAAPTGLQRFGLPLCVASPAPDTHGCDIADIDVHLGIGFH